MKNKPTSIVIHCSDVPTQTLFDQFNSINGNHRDVRKFPKSSLGYYIGYHRLITGDKNYQCRLDDDEGAHCNQGFDGKIIYAPGMKPEGVLSMNFQSLGICVGFDGDIEYMTPIQYGLLQKQIFEWQDKYSIPNDRVYLHRYFAKDKTCPGSLIKDNWLKTLLERPKPIVVPTKPIENLCVAQETTIKKLKEQISWYEKLLANISKWLG